MSVTIQLDTTALAIYGAVLSTIAVGWNIINSILANQPKIKITYSPGFITGLEEPAPRTYTFTGTNLKKCQ